MARKTFMVETENCRLERAWFRYVNRRENAEAGDTLIEILFAVTIFAIAVIALLGGLITIIGGSTEHRSLAVEDTILKSYAETIKQDIGVGAPVPYSLCPATYAIPYTPPTGYTASISQVEYWNGTSFVSTPCLGHDLGLQQLTLTAVARNGFNQTLQVVIRNPNYAP